MSDHNLQKPQFSFGVFADVQYAEYEPEIGRYFRDSAAKLAQCVDKFNLKELAFIVQLGDLIDSDFANFDKMLSVLGRLKTPIYHILGNHDFAVSPEQKPKVPEKLGLKNRYYDFTHQNWRFVVLDSGDISFYANDPESAKYKKAEKIYNQLADSHAPNAETWNGGIDIDQIAWLKRTLGDASVNGQNVIVFCHAPFYPQTRYNLWNDAELVETFESFDCVTACISGHNHHGNYSQKKGIHYLTLCAMVETPDENAYAIIEAYPDRLKVIGFGAVPARTLNIKTDF